MARKAIVRRIRRSTAGDPRRRRRYTLAELLRQCDPNEPLPEYDREWLDAAPAGKELL